MPQVEVNADVDMKDIFSPSTDVEPTKKDVDATAVDGN